MSDASVVAPRGSALTERELAALRAWRRHGSERRAARALKKSVHTIHAQLRNARSRLGVRTTAEAAHKALD